MNRTLQRWVAIITASALVLSGLVLVLTMGQASAVDGEETNTEQADALAVTNAQLAWSINDEAGGGAFFGGCNFLSAGKAGDTGSSRLWTKADGLYQTDVGNVRIEKRGSGDTWVTPTWENKCQDADGNAVGTTVGSTTKNRVVLTGGSGWIDEVSGAAEIKFTGSFTVVFYGGLTYWSASDPILQIYDDNTGRLIARTSGYGASMEDSSKWERLPDAYVELATFSDVAAQLADFTAQADYLERKITVPGSVTPQKTSGEYWGAFPQSFVDYQIQTGQASYWYSSDGQTDPKKIAHEVSVSDITATEPASSAQYTTVTLGNVDGSTYTPTPSTKPSDSGSNTKKKTKNTKKATKEFTVKSAVLRWGINNETSSAAFYGGCNFMVAGEVGNVGKSRVWTKQDGLYTSKKGKVEILKPDANGKLARATWENKCLDRDGNAVTTSSKTTTESLVNISGGTGKVNPKKGTATIRWKGSFTVAFYGGMTYWYVTDPVLTIKKNGSGTLKAVAGGYGADMDDPTKWVALKERTIDLATFKNADVSGKKGMTLTPQYLGVKVTTGDGARSNQAEKTSENAEYWGAFPQSFVDFQIETGQSAYWYTSGGSRDWAKVASDLEVIYDETDAKNTTKKTSGNNSTSDDEGATVSNPLNTRPTTLSSAPTSDLPPTSTTPTVTNSATAASAWTQQGPATTIVALGASDPVPVAAQQPLKSENRTVSIVWAGIGAGLLAGAVIVLLPSGSLAGRKK